MPNDPQSHEESAEGTARLESQAKLQLPNPTLIVLEGEPTGKYIQIRSATDVTLLILGESGTGKDLVARAVHEASRRARQPLVVFDCSSVSPELLASELFGHVEGAFTGASRSRRGAFEAAAGGTLFLDEIGE